MRKSFIKCLSTLIFLSLILGLYITTAFAADVSSWSSLIFSSIDSRGFNNEGVSDREIEPLNESVHNPSTSIQHYKDTIYLKIKTGSITQIQVTLDGTALTGSNMQRSDVQSYSSTFGIYYWTSTFTFTNLGDIADPDAETSALRILTRNPSNTSQTSTNTLYINWHDFRPDAPASATFIYNDPANPGKAVLTGVDDTMEYRLQSNYNGWTGITGSSVVFDLPAADTAYYVHYANPESKSKPLTMRTIPAAPSVALNILTEQLTGLDTTMEIKIDDGDYFPVTNSVVAAGASPFIDAVEAGNTATMHIRVRASELYPQGPEQTLTLYPRTSAPSGLSYNPITATVSGVTTAMQYRVQNGTWANVTGTTQNVEALLSATSDVTLEVRKKAVSGVSSASPTVTLTLNQLPAAPNLSLDLRREFVTGFDSGKSYQYNTTGSLTSWSAAALTNGEFSLNGIINKNNAVSLYFREASTSTTPASASVSLTVPKLQDAPTTARFVFNDPNHPNQAVVAGLTTSMEFRRSVDTTWTLYTGADIVVDIPLSNMFCYVRKIAQGGLPNSAVQNLTLPYREAAPSVTLNTSTETVGTVSTSMETSTNGVTYTGITSGSTYSVSNIIDSIQNGTATLYVRTKATATAPATLSKTFVLYPRAAAPSGLSYNPVTCIVSGVSNTMQYRVQGATTWTAISSTTLNVESLLSKTSNVNLEIRYGPISNVSSSSTSSIVVLNQLPAAPTFNKDLEREVITGFSSDKSYQYNTTGSATSWSAVTLNNGEFNISSLISTSANVYIYIREARTADLPATAAAQILIPMRPAAPSSPQLVYTNINYPNKAVLTGLSSYMEYKKSTDSTWSNYMGEDILFDIPSSNATYYVRYKAQGSTTPASQNLTLTLKARGAAPTVTLDIMAETVGTVSTNMEISTDGVVFTRITSGSTYSVSSIIDAISTASNPLYIRYAANSSSPYSNSQTILLYRRFSPPATITYNPVTCTISGISSSMQYRRPGNSNWTSVSSSSMNVEDQLISYGNVTYEFRYMPVAGVYSASTIVNVILNQLPAAPNLTLDFPHEVISGFSSARTYEYRTTTTGSWTPLTLVNNEFNLASLLSPTVTYTYNIRATRTADLPATAIKQIVIGPRPAAPTNGIFEYNNASYPDQAVLINLTSDLEYKKSTDATWTSYEGQTVVFDIPASNAAYYIRKKGIGSTTPPSQNRTIYNYARSAAPSVTMNITNETIGTLTTSMEISIDGTNYTRITEATSAYSISGFIDTISSGTITLNVRNSATTNAPSSSIKTFTLYPRVSTPEGITYDPNTRIVSGVSDAMQYRVQGTSSWTAISSITLNAESLVGNTIEIRNKPVDGVSSASQVVMVEII